MPYEIDEKLLEEIFGHTIIKLTDKLINRTNKEENQTIVSSIKKNKNKLFEMDEFSDWVIKPNSQRISLLDTIDLILDFNKTIQLDLVSVQLHWVQFHWAFIEIKMSELFLIRENTQNYWSLYVNNKKLFFSFVYKMFNFTKKHLKIMV